MNSAVAILNWNGIDLLKKFLPSVVEFTPNSTSIYVVDNGSTDNSIELIKSNFPSVKLIDNGANLGYAGGYNAALKKLDEELVVLLNSDAEVSKGWLEPLISRLKSSNEIAACQPKIKAFHDKPMFEYAGACGGMIDYLGYPFCRGRIFDTCELDSGQYDAPMKVFWATGTCLAVKREAFQEVGGLDEDFFAHMEEIDLCWRLQRAGHDIWVEPSSTIYHLGGGTLNAQSPRKTFLNFRNGLAMITKNASMTRLIWLIPTRLVLDGMAGVKFLLTGMPGHTWAVIKAHFSFYFGVVKWIRKRRGMFEQVPQIWSESIVWAYFVKDKKKFSDLNF